MRKYITSLLILFSLNLTHAQTQIQNARVKTRGRMVDGQYIPGKGLPGTVVSIEGITDIGVRNSNGTFSFPVGDNSFFVKSVTKNEYALIDSDAAPKAYNYSKDTLYFVMAMPEQMLNDLVEAQEKIRKTLERELANAKAEIKRLKDEKQITQEEYLRRMEQIISNQEKNEDLVNEMAKRYSTLDYDQLDDFYRQVSYYIEQGELTKADSLLRTKGNVVAKIDEQLEKRASLHSREREVRQVDVALECEFQELIQRSYKYYETFKKQGLTDSATFYIKQCVDLDTLNAKLQLDAASYLQEQKLFDEAEFYYKRTFDIYNDKALYDSVVVVLNRLVLIYEETQQYEKCNKTYEELLKVYQRLSADSPKRYKSDIKRIKKLIRKNKKQL